MAAARWDWRLDIFSLAALLHEMLWARRVAAVGREAADDSTGLPGADMKRRRQPSPARSPKILLNDMQRGSSLPRRSQTHFRV